MPERLKAARRRTVGAKQTIRALHAGQAIVVYVAKDAERRLVRSVVEDAGSLGVELVEVDSMSKLGRLCSIDVGAACAGLLADPVLIRHDA